MGRGALSHAAERIVGRILLLRRPFAPTRAERCNSIVANSSGSVGSWPITIVELDVLNDGPGGNWPATSNSINARRGASRPFVPTIS